MEQNNHSDNHDGNREQPTTASEQTKQQPIKRKRATSHKRGNPHDPIHEPAKWLKWLVRYRKTQVELAIAFVLMLATLATSYFTWWSASVLRQFADRPYIEVTELRSPPLKRGEFPVLVLDIQNVGKTPAVDLYIRSGGGSTFKPEPVDHILAVHVPQIPHAHGPFQLAPGQHRIQPLKPPDDRPITDVQYELYTRRIVHMYVIGGFKYRDVLGNSYDSERFCYEYRPYPKAIAAALSIEQQAFRPCDDEAHENK